MDLWAGGRREAMTAGPGDWFGCDQVFQPAEIEDASGPGRWRPDHHPPVPGGQALGRAGHQCQALRGQHVQFAEVDDDRGDSLATTMSKRALSWATAKVSDAPRTAMTALCSERSVKIVTPFPCHRSRS